MSVFAKLASEAESATPMFFITVADDPKEDNTEPPAHQIMCDGMYEWAADWLVETLNNAKAQFPEGPPKPEPTNV